jgi:hypothetical protein
VSDCSNVYCTYRLIHVEEYTEIADTLFPDGQNVLESWHD